MSAMASLITSLSIIYSTLSSGADQRKHQRSASLDFVRGIQRWPVNSPHKGPITRKTFPFDDVVMRHFTLWPHLCLVQTIACDLFDQTNYQRFHIRNALVNATCSIGTLLFGPSSVDRFVMVLFKSEQAWIFLEQSVVFCHKYKIMPVDELTQADTMLINIVHDGMGPSTQSIQLGHQVVTIYL